MCAACVEAAAAAAEGGAGEAPEGLGGEEGEEGEDGEGEDGDGAEAGGDEDVGGGLDSTCSERERPEVARERREGRRAEGRFAEGRRAKGRFAKGRFALGRALWLLRQEERGAARETSGASAAILEAGPSMETERGAWAVCGS